MFFSLRQGCVAYVLFKTGLITAKYMTMHPKHND